MCNTKGAHADQESNRFAGLRVVNLSHAEQQAVIDLALGVLASRHRARRCLTSPTETRNYLCLRLADYRQEVFGCLFLDTRHRIMEMTELFYGTIDGTSVHPRIVVQRALEANAAAVIFFHNHPSGVAEPSEADQLLTRRLHQALALVDIRVIDHLVVGGADSVSFAERGLL